MMNESLENIKFSLHNSKEIADVKHNPVVKATMLSWLKLIPVLGELIDDTLLKLLDLIREFCREVALGNNDEQCIRLKEAVENAEGNDYLTLLSSYLSICDTGDEVIEALEEL